MTWPAVNQLFEPTCSVKNLLGPTNAIGENVQIAIWKLPSYGRWMDYAMINWFAPVCEQFYIEWSR
jgi:hypothetical protein